jgi:hypothetical protein
MFSNYFLTGCICLLISFLWYFKIRNLKQYGKNDAIDDFANIDESFYEKMDNWERGGTDFLVVLVFIYGIIFLYNSLAILFELPLILEKLNPF